MNSKISAGVRKKKADIGTNKDIGFKVIYGI